MGDGNLFLERRVNKVNRGALPNVLNDCFFKNLNMQAFCVFCFAIRMLSRGGIYTRNENEPKPADERQGKCSSFLFSFFLSLMSSVGTFAFYVVQILSKYI